MKRQTAFITTSYGHKAYASQINSWGVVSMHYVGRILWNEQREEYVFRQGAFVNELSIQVLSQIHQKMSVLQIEATCKK